MASGSACRSLFGGFVQWNSGSIQEPNTSFVFKFAPSLPEIYILIYMFSSARKSISSTDAMSRTKRLPLCLSIEFLNFYLEEWMNFVKIFWKRIILRFFAV